jgi:polysaccharide pyruvyl transferase WcaK-like protein
MHEISNNATISQPTNQPLPTKRVAPRKANNLEALSMITMANLLLLCLLHAGAGAQGSATVGGTGSVAISQPGGKPMILVVMGNHHVKDGLYHFNNYGDQLMYFTIQAICDDWGVTCVIVRDFAHALEQAKDPKKPVTGMFILLGYFFSDKFGARITRQAQDAIKLLQHCRAEGIFSAMLPQAVGPFDHSKPLYQEMVRMFPLLDSVMVRDQAAVDAVKGIGLAARAASLTTMHPFPPVTMVQDTVYSSARPKIEAAKQDRKLPEICFSVSNKLKTETEKAHRPFLAPVESLIATITKNATLLLIPHEDVYFTSGVHAQKGDRTLILGILKKVRSNPRVSMVDVPAPEVSKIEQAIAGCDVLITMRFHALVLAARVATPVVAFSWAPKYADMLGRLGLEEKQAIVSLEHEMETMQKVWAMYDDRQAISAMIREHAMQLTSEVDAAYATLKEPVFDAYRKRLAAGRGEAATDAGVQQGSSRVQGSPSSAPLEIGVSQGPGLFGSACFDQCSTSSGMAGKSPCGGASQLPDCPCAGLTGVPSRAVQVHSEHADLVGSSARCWGSITSWAPRAYHKQTLVKSDTTSAETDELEALVTYDKARVLNWMASEGRDLTKLTYGNLEALLLKYQHQIEKGLSLPKGKDFRPGFGSSVWARLQKFSSVFIDRFGHDHFALQAIAAVADEYNAWHKSTGNTPDAGATAVANALRTRGVVARKDAGGTVTVPLEAVRKASLGSFRDVAHVRHSIRQWGPQPVADADVVDAINLAAEGTPSVCNRQTIGAIVITNKLLMDQVLAIQGGARGIDKPEVLIGVVGSLERFREPRERNQVYVDGGLFGMSLMYAFQSKVLATCPLNFAAKAVSDTKMRTLLNVTESTVFIMFLAVSHYRDEVVHTVSPRRGAEDLNAVVWQWQK